MRKIWIAIPLILVMLLLCLAMAGTALFTVRNFQSLGIQLPVRGVSNIQVEAEEEKTFQVTSPASLQVENMWGVVRVEKGGDGQIEMRAKKIARGPSQAAAQQNMDRLQIVTRQQGDTVQISVEIAGNSNVNWEGSVDFTIRVPEQTSVTVDSRFGDVELSGTNGTLDLSTSFGRIDVQGARGGPFTVVTRNGRLTFRDVQAGDTQVDLRSDFGDVTVESVSAGQVLANSKNGAVSLKDVQATGLVDLQSDFGRISFERGSAGDLRVENKNGDVNLSGLPVSGALVASSNFGSIRLNQVAAARYDLNSRNGGISVDTASGPIKASTDFGDVEIRNAREASLDLRSKNGPLRFTGSLGPGPHNLQSDFGSVTLVIPAGSALDFDLSTNFGKIDSALDVTIQGKPDEKHWQGKINGGGPLLTVTTKNGNISLEIGQ